MKKPTEPRIPVDLSESNWCHLVNYNLCDLRSTDRVARRRAAPGQNPAEVLQEMILKNEGIWPEVKGITDDDTFVKRVAPALIATGFFAKTKYNHLALVPSNRFLWEANPTVKLSVSSGGVIATRDTSIEDFTYSSGEDFLDFLTGIAAEAIIAVCDKYKLDKNPALELAAKYPVSNIAFSHYSPMPLETLYTPPADYKSAR